MPAENTAAVLDEVPCPDMRHLAIDILEVLVGHRNPLGFGCRAGRSGIHIRFAGKKNILLAVFMALYIRPESLERVVDRHIEAVEAEEVVGISGREDTVEMVLFAIDRVAADIEDIAQRLLSSVLGLATPYPQTQRLATAHQHQHQIDQERVRQCPSLVVKIGFLGSIHYSL